MGFNFVFKELNIFLFLAHMQTAGIQLGMLFQIFYLSINQHIALSSDHFQATLSSRIVCILI